MDQGKISRKHAKGAHGQVMQVVENVYEESDEKKLDEKHGEVPEAFKKKAEEMKAKSKSKKEKMASEHGEDGDMTDSGVQKRHGGDGGPGSADHAEDPTGRYETARSSDDGYVDRMKTGKAGAGSETGRFKTAKSGEQDNDRMHTAENGEQDSDRLNTAKASPSDQDGDRWAGQADGYDQVTNMDQYDDGASDYGVNSPKTSKGTDPYGRDETETKMPTESEEMPDDKVFAVSTVNVMSDGSMRVLRQTSSQGRQAVKGGPIANFKEPEADEETSEMGVTAHGEGSGKPSKEKQLTPGAMDTVDDPAETVGPSGAFAESYRGEKKAGGKVLTPGAMDEVNDPAEITGPSGVTGGAEHGENNLSGDFQGGPSEKVKKSGGAYAEEHGEKKDPYTKTGFGSTYEEGEGVDEGDEDYNELSADHSCGMDYGMGSMGQAKAVGFPQQMYEELQALKTKYAEMERRHAEEKMMHRRQQMANFVEALYTEGRLTDGIIPEQELISYCEGLEFGTMEFSEGETAATKLLGLLSKLPPMVSFGEVAGGTFQYAEEDLDPHAKALRMVEESEGAIDYVEALKKTMFS